MAVGLDQLRPFLNRRGPRVVGAYALCAAFWTYFAMYAFRKPFTAASYSGLQFLGTPVEFKTVLVISQIVGYATSKYCGIKVCSEAPRERRLPLLVTLIACAEVALIAFAVVPLPWKVVAICANGLPLGMVWGLVVRYLEGRRTSEVLLAGLSCSFIVSSGMVKDVGRTLMAGDPLFGITALRLPFPISEFWMPAATGLVFLPLFLIAAWLLEQTPEPSRLDVEARSLRRPMSRLERTQFARAWLPGIVMLVASYLCLTAFRDFRDNYMVEVLDELGYRYESHKNLISTMEAGVAFGVFLAVASLVFITNNRLGLAASFAVMLSGMATIGTGTALWQAGMISGLAWMALLGLGTYLAYVPYQAILFDRLMAAMGTGGTAVFGIYVADACGYSGSAVVQLFKDVAVGQSSRLEFLTQFAYVMSAAGVVLLAASSVYFLLLTRSPTDCGRSNIPGDDVSLAYSPSIPFANVEPATIAPTPSV